MSFHTWDVVTTLFKVMCGLVVVFMIGFWLYKYQKNEDLCLVDYKFVKDFKEKVLPVFNVCFVGGIMDKLLNQVDPNITGPTYLEYLRGKVFEEKFNSIDYNRITVNLTDYLAEVFIQWKNGSNAKYTFPDENMPIETSVTFSGFIPSTWHFLKCFGTEVKHEYKDDVGYVFSLYKRAGLLGNDRDVSGQVYSMFHYPKQLQHTTKQYKPLRFDQNFTENNIKMHLISNIEILKRRNKRNEPCLDGEDFYDDLHVHNHIEKVGCRAPYLAPYKDYPKCSTQRELEMSIYSWEPVAERYVQGKYKVVPCQGMSKIEFTYNEDQDRMRWVNDSYFAVGVGYPERVKVIVQSQAVDFHSLVGNIGGYIGLFLGMITNYILKLFSK